MKTLLVYPEFPDTYWSFHHALSFEGKRSAFPSLGPLTISAMLPDAWERRLVDMNIQRLKPSDIEWADVVFCSAMLVQKDSLRRVVALCKAEGKRVVIEGPYVTTSAGGLPQAELQSSAMMGERSWLEAKTKRRGYGALRTARPSAGVLYGCPCLTSSSV